MVVSLGIGYDIKVNGDWIFFKNFKVTNFEQFDFRNLFMCRYLNLRGSSFISIPHEIL